MRTLEENINLKARNKAHKKMGEVMDMIPAHLDHYIDSDEVKLKMASTKNSDVRSIVRESVFNFYVRQYHKEMCEEVLALHQKVSEMLGNGEE